MGCCNEDSPPEVPLELSAGESRSITITITDDDGARVDLTGARLTFTVRKKINTAVVLTKSSTVSGEIDILTPQTDADKTGKAALTLEAADTSGLRGTFVYDIWLVTIGGSAFPVVAPSPFVVRETVTTSP